MQLRPYVFSVFGLFFMRFFWLLRFLCCCARSRSQYVFLKAEKKLNRQLDIVKVFKGLRKADLLAKVILSQKQHYFAKFAKRNLLEPPPHGIEDDQDVGGSDHSDGEIVSWHPKHHELMTRTYLP